MSTIISLSPWSSFWDMGKESGTSSIFVAVQALKRIASDVLHFVEDGPLHDEGNISIPIHMERVPYKYKTLFRRFGSAGRRLLFEIEASQWRRYNDEFLSKVTVELGNRNIHTVDMVYCHSPYLVRCGRELANRFSCPVVAHFYGTFLATCIGDLDAYRKNAVEYLGWTAPVDLRICHNDGTRGLEVARDLLLPMEKFLYQPHGLDAEEFDLQNAVDIADYVDPGKHHVMTASRLVDWKRVDRLLNAIPEVCRSIKNVRFLILGDGPDRRRLEQIAEQLGISENVRFVGSLPRNTVFALMRACDVFVSTNDLSNISRGLKEAMHLGMCVVTLDTGETKELIKDNITGRLLPPDDQRALSAALIDVLSNPEKLRSLGQAASSYIHQHEPTKASVIDERVERLKSLLATRCGGS